MKSYGGMEVQPLSFLTLAQDRFEWQVSCRGGSTRGKEVPASLEYEAWRFPTAGVDTVEST
jgi:hypothetical protein